MAGTPRRVSFDQFSLKLIDDLDPAPGFNRTAAKGPRDLADAMTHCFVRIEISVDYVLIRSHLTGFRVRMQPDRSELGDFFFNRHLVHKVPDPFLDTPGGLFIDRRCHWILPQMMMILKSGNRRAAVTSCWFALMDSNAKAADRSSLSEMRSC